jgi:signal transduction histidine kinase
MPALAGFVASGAGKRPQMAKLGGMSHVNLEAPLPPELTGRNLGWFSRYRRWPVFSGPWVRGRLLMTGSLAVLGLVLTVAPLLFKPLEEFPLGGLVHMAAQLFLPLLAGPALGWGVRRQAWPPRTEAWGLAAAMLAVVLAMLAFHEWGAEPAKQWLAEQTGQVDEQGQRKKVLLAIGVMVRPVDATGNPAAEGNPSPQTPEVRLANTTASAALSFWLAGGAAALWGWRRERAGLAALARERELAQAQASRREAELRLSVLAAQVEPHFLFNTLAGVRSAIHSDPARASLMVEQLVDYLRASIPQLRGDGRAQASVGAQFEIVGAYLGLMAARMPRLAYSLDAPADLLQAHCPPLMLISLAENAVKHGVEPKLGPARVDVRAERRPDGRLALTVLDDGVGFDAGPANGQVGSGLGLSNIRARLAQLYGERASLALRARAEGGVAATLLLPLEDA